MSEDFRSTSSPDGNAAGLDGVAENKKSRKKTVIAVASVAVVAVLAGGGYFGWKAYAGHQLADARQACVEASESYRKAVNGYSTLVDGDAATASQITVKQVADAKTRDELSKAVKAKDAGLIAAASKKVNDSMAAKTKADAEAKAKAEQEAQAQAAAEAAAQAQQSYSAPRQSYTPSYTAPQRSYTPSYSGGSTSGGGSGSSVPDFVPSSGGYGVEPDGSWHPGNIIQH